MLRVLKFALSIELILVGLLAGLGQIIVRAHYFVADAASAAQVPLLITQFPGALVLTEFGLCCGFGGGYVFTDLNPHLRMGVHLSSLRPTFRSSLQLPGLFFGVVVGPESRHPEPPANQS